MKVQTKGLLNSKNKANAMSSAFDFQLDFKIQKTNIGTQKINGTILDNYGMVISIFSVLDKDSKERFFKKNFLFAHVNPDIVFEILFLTIRNADFDFQV